MKQDINPILDDISHIYWGDTEETVSALDNIRDDLMDYPVVPKSESMSYDVTDKDTLFSLSEKIGVHPEDISELNDYRQVKPGQTINVPPTKMISTYQGETMPQNFRDAVPSLGPPPKYTLSPSGETIVHPDDWGDISEAANPYYTAREQSNMAGEIFVPDSFTDYDQTHPEATWEIEDPLKQIRLLQPDIKVGALSTLLDVSSLVPLEDDMAQALRATNDANRRLEEFQKSIYQTALTDGTYPTDQDGTPVGYDSQEVADRIQSDRHLIPISDRDKAEHAALVEALDRNMTHYFSTRSGYSSAHKELLSKSVLDRNVPKGLRIGDLPYITPYNFYRAMYKASKVDYDDGLKIYQNKVNKLNPKQKEIWETMFGTQEGLHNKIHVAVIPHAELMGKFTGVYDVFGNMLYEKNRPHLGKEYVMDITTLSPREVGYADKSLFMQQGYQEDPETFAEAIGDQIQQAAMQDIETDLYEPTDPPFKGKIKDLDTDDLLIYPMRTDPWIDHRTGKKLRHTYAEYPQPTYWESVGGLGTQDPARVQKQDLLGFGTDTQVFWFHGEERVNLPVAGHEIGGHGKQVKIPSAPLRPRPDGSFENKWAYRWHEIGAEWSEAVRKYRVQRGDNTLAPLDLNDFTTYLENKIVAPPYPLPENITEVYEEILDIMRSWSDEEKEALRYMIGHADENNQVMTMSA